MPLPIRPPFPPMEALLVSSIPKSAGWQYEPKWDGFRCLVFRDGDSVEFQSKSGQPLTRYFPELVETFLGLKAKQFVLDGEIAVVLDERFSFDEGLLNHVGFCSGLKASERRELVAKLQPLIQPPGFTGSAPGGPSRWSTARTAEWQPLSPLVVEVSYDHFTGGRFRYGTSLIRWRPDKKPEQCTMEQIQPGSTNALQLLK